MLEIKNVLVVGAGTMGSQIALQTALSGRYRVALVDSNPEQLERARAQNIETIIYDTCGLIDPRVGGTALKLRIDLARTKQSMTLDGAVKWVRFNEDSGLHEMGVEFLHLTSSKVLALIKHLYGQNWRILPPVN